MPVVKFRLSQAHFIFLVPAFKITITLGCAFGWKFVTLTSTFIRLSHPDTKFNETFTFRSGHEPAMSDDVNVWARAGARCAAAHTAAQVWLLVFWMTHFAFYSQPELCVSRRYICTF